MDSVDKFAKDVTYRIEQHSDRLDTPESVTETAIDLYEQFNNEDAAYSRPDDVFALASIYVAHKVEDVPTLVSDVTNGTDIEDKHVNRAAREIQSKLAKAGVIQYQTFSVDSFIGKFSSQLDLEEDTESRALEIYDTAQDILANYAANTAAAASISLAVELENERVKQKDISEVSDTSGVTIRRRADEIKEEISIDA